MEFSIEVRVRRVRDGNGDTVSVSLPRYATEGSAGLDLHACIGSPLEVPPGSRLKVPTGISIEIPHRFIAGLVFPRSGLASKHGISLANAVGVVDSDYKGEIMVAIYNQGPDLYVITPGERIAQLVFVPIFKATLHEVDSLEVTGRGTGGFGSTGKI